VYLYSLVCLAPLLLLFLAIVGFGLWFNAIGLALAIGCGMGMGYSFFLLLCRG